MNQGTQFTDLFTRNILPMFALRPFKPKKFKKGDNITIKKPCTKNARLKKKS